MGKIYDALAKYRQERLLAVPVPKLRKADWEILLTYDRNTSKLNLNNEDVIKDSETVPRLLANKMILPDGTLTVAGRKRSEKYRIQSKKKRAETFDKLIEQAIDVEKPVTSKPAAKCEDSDLAALLQYDRETGNILRYDPEIGQLDTSSKLILREPETIQRLIDNGMILPGGWLTPKGMQESEKLEQLSKKGPSDDLNSKVFRHEQPEENKPTKVRDADQKKRKVIQPKDKKPIELPSEIQKQRKEKQSAEKFSAYSKAKKNGAEEVRPVTKAPVAPSQDELEKKILGMRPASVSHESEAIDKILVSQLDPNSYEAEQFKILRINLLYAVSGKIPRSIAVTSALPGEGKSFVSANLSISIAHEIDRYVLLIDCDLRRPRIHRLFGFGDVPGLSDFLCKGTPLESLLLKTKIDKLSILPAGPIPANPSEILSSERMSALVQEVSLRYKNRLIILDTPPPTVISETGALAKFVDGILVVVKCGSTTMGDLEDLIRTLGKEKVIGSVLNNVDMRSSRYYGYHKFHGYYSAGIINSKS